MNTTHLTAIDQLQSSVADLKVFKRDELKGLFVKYHRWANDKSNCGNKARKEGKEAHRLIVLHNLKLVIKIAHQYKYSGAEPDDLINEGTIGLLTAVERFDINNGAKFSSYSSIWIKQAIRRHLSNKSRTIRIPSHVAEKIGKVKDYIKDYQAENNNTNPSVDEIKSNVKGISKKILNDLINGGVINLLSVDFKLSTDDKESDATFGDVLEDEKIVAPDKNGLMANDIENLKYYLNKLSRREKSIVSRRFGMKDGYPETLDHIAETYGISRERIRQIQIVAMRKLRTMMGKKYQDNFFIPKYFR
jgi:RNA polymerase primary sigma factor